MAIAFIAGGSGAAASSDTNSVTTAGLNTTGATLIVVAVAFGAASSPTVSDSNSNSWTPLTHYQEVNNVGVQLFYTIPTSVGSGHTFTASLTGSFPGIAVASFSGTAASSVFDTPNQNGNSQNFPGSAALATNSITPSAANYVVLAAGQCSGTVSTLLPDSGFTVAGSELGAAGLAYGVGLAYLIQTSATAENVVWTVTGGGNILAAAIASFKASAGGGGFVAVNRRTLGPRVGSRSRY